MWWLRVVASYWRERPWRGLGMLALLISTAAYAGIIVHGQLVDASLESLASDPSSPAEGRVYDNTTSHKAKYYANSAWLTILDTATAVTATNLGLTTKGDLVSYTGSAVSRLAVGSNGQVLSADSTQTSGLKWTGVLTDPMTTTGDIIYSSDNSGTAARLAIGASTTVLHGGTTPAYSQVVNADVSSSAAIAGSKLQAAGSANTGTVSFEQSGTFNLTFTGPRTTSAKVVRYVRVGNMVTLDVPADTGASCNSTSTNFSSGANLQTNLIPATATGIGIVRVQDSGTDQTTPGEVQVSTGGVVQIYKNFTGPNWTTSASCGWYEFQVTYPVN